MKDPYLKEVTCSECGKTFMARPDSLCVYYNLCETHLGNTKVARLTPESKLNYCRDTLGHCCRSHFYNGHNPGSIKECWNLADAELARRELPISVDSCEKVEVVTLKCFSPQWDMNEAWVAEAGLSPKPLLTVNIADVTNPKIRVSKIPDENVARIALKGVTVARGNKVTYEATIEIDISTYLAAGLIFQLQQVLGLND